MPIVIVNTESNRSPFQIYLVALAVLGGIGILTKLSKNMIVDAMGKPYSTLWGLFLVIGGMLIILGIFWPRNIVTALLIERSGLVALGGASLIWSILVVWKVHTGGLFSALLTFGLFLACLAQWRWVNKNVSSIVKAVNKNS